MTWSILKRNFLRKLAQSHIARGALCFVLPVLMQLGCVSPTFEGAEVRRGLHGWAGAVSCYRSYDCSDYEYRGTENGLGFGGAGGIYYGLTERLAMGLGASGFIIVSGDNQLGPLVTFPDVSFNFKYEFTSATSPIVFSSAMDLRPVQPIPRLCPMVGLRKGDTEVIAFGAHVAPIPYDIFLTTKPFSSKGLVAYVGHQILWALRINEYFEAGNIAIGMGYRW